MEIEMTTKNVNIDGTEYSTENLSDSARKQLNNIQFVETRIQQLSNELAISDTARIAYAAALKKEVAKIEEDKG